MNGMTITMLNGLGCSQCGGARNVMGLGATTDYDKITVGGKTYTANQLLDKTVIASVDTKIYSNPSGTGTVVGTIKAGQPIGKVYSYIKPNQSTSGGRSWLMFEYANQYNKFFYAPNEAVSSAGLKDQGTKTLQEEVKDEADAKLKDESPIEYYIKKYALKVGLAIGVVIIVKTLVQEGVRASSKKSTPPTTATT